MELKRRPLRADEARGRAATARERGVFPLLCKAARRDRNLLGKAVGPMDRRPRSRDSANGAALPGDEEKKQRAGQEARGVWGRRRPVHTAADAPAGLDGRADLPF